MASPSRADKDAKEATKRLRYIASTSQALAFLYRLDLEKALANLKCGRCESPYTTNDREFVKLACHECCEVCAKEVQQDEGGFCGCGEPMNVTQHEYPQGLHEYSVIADQTWRLFEYVRREYEKIVEGRGQLATVRIQLESTPGSQIETLELHNPAADEADREAMRAFEKTFEEAEKLSLCGGCAAPFHPSAIREARMLSTCHIVCAACAQETLNDHTLLPEGQCPCCEQELGATTYPARIPQMARLADLFWEMKAYHNRQGSEWKRLVHELDEAEELLKLAKNVQGGVNGENREESGQNEQTGLNGQGSAAPNEEDEDQKSNDVPRSSRDG